jgi:hypothetical protein
MVKIDWSVLIMNTNYSASVITVAGTCSKCPGASGAAYGYIASQGTYSC